MAAFFSGLGWTVRRAFGEKSYDLAAGQRNKCLFEFARRLKAIAALADAPTEALRPYVRRWFELAEPVMETKDFDQTWSDFTHGWTSVKFPLGAGSLEQALAQAERLALPAAALRYEGAALRLLVALCPELQRSAGPEPFYLGTPTASRLLASCGFDHDRMTIWRWFGGLQRDGVLQLVGAGNQRHANRHRYLPEIEELTA